MTRAGDLAQVTAASYRGKIVLLYFGYTHCPDLCPATLANLSDALTALGGWAKQTRVLFVTVDPERDTLPVLAAYVRAFSSQVDGLRGDADALVSLARRYRVAFGQTKAPAGQPYGVMHSEAVFFFDRRGRARFVATSTENRSEVVAVLRGLLDAPGDSIDRR
ncbi:MAG: SCO family protein [Alphaproteobacteria bacterium]|nr:SCO family protein [Alphaproteobacteria bacterium]